MTLPLDTAPFFSGTDLSFTADGLPAGLAIAPETGIITGAPLQVETRPVTITASNAAGSAQQNFSWTITAPMTVPEQVTGMSAVSGDGQAALSWDVPADNGAAITDYIIERSIAGGAFSTLADGTGSTPSFTDTGLTNGTEYSYRVSAVNGVGTGPVSTPVSATPSAGGAALSILAFAHGETGSVNQSVSTFPALSVAPGEVIVAVSHRGSADNNQVTGVTVGGQAATLVGREFVFNQTKQEQSVWRSPVTGTSADVEVTTTAATSRCGVAIWSVGSIDTTSVGFAAETATGTPGLASSIDVASGGLVLAHATLIGSGAVFSWTGLDATFQTEASPTYWHAGADREFVSPVSGHAVGADFGGTFNNAILTLVSVAPA